MIKAEDKGEKTCVQITGSGLELIEEFSAITAALADHCPAPILEMAFKMGLHHKGKVKTDDSGSDAAEALLEILLGEDGKEEGKEE